LPPRPPRALEKVAGVFAWKKSVLNNEEQQAISIYRPGSLNNAKTFLFQKLPS
jgi:hypothetical protein